MAGLSGWCIAAGVLWAWLGTQYLYHAVRFPMMANVVSTFWVTACVVLCADAVAAIRARRREDRAGEDADNVGDAFGETPRARGSGGASAAADGRAVGWHWPAIAFTLSMAFICRPTNVVVAVFVVFALYELLRERQLPRIVRWVPLIALALVPVVLQMLVWRVMFGSYVTFSYGGANTFRGNGPERFFWTDPVLWQSLFSVKAGLFLWCPIWAVGTLGAVVYAFRRVPGVWVVGCYVIAFALLWYLNSAWWCWPFSCYPGRAYLELVGLPALGLALLFQYTATNLARRRVLLGVLLLGLLCTEVLEVGYDLSLVPRYADDLILQGPAGAARAR